MNKNSQYLFNSSWIVAFFIIQLFFSACQNHKKELKYLNALQVKLEENNSNFDLDITLFETRTSFIQNTLRTFKNDYNDTLSLDLGNALSRYKGIRKIYDNHILNYLKNKKEQTELEKQLKDLEADLRSGKLSKEEFKTYFNTEKIDVEALIKSTTITRKTLYEVEPEYTRITKYLIPILDSL